MDAKQRNGVLAARIRGDAPPSARTPKVVNKHWFPGGILPPGTAYIGRGSPYGNPFPITAQADRNLVCDQFEVHFEKHLENPAFVAQMLRDLAGKDLACFCKRTDREVRCHGDTILRAVNNRTARS